MTDEAKALKLDAVETITVKVVTPTGSPAAPQETVTVVLDAAGKAGETSAGAAGAVGVEPRRVKTLGWLARLIAAEKTK